MHGLPPGDYYVSANNRSNMMMMPAMTNTEADAFAPPYSPGTPNISEATRVTVTPGQEMTGANFALIVARMARVKGRALNSRGEPVTNAMLMMMPDEPVMTMSMGMNNSMTAGDGSFQFANIAPGRYNLQVRPNGMPSASSEFATLKITVGNDDIDNLLVTTAVGATARGVVITDDGSAPPFRADQVSLFPTPAEPGGMMVSPGTNRINDDFTFELSGLSERRLIRANVAQTLGWFVKAVMLDGEDVTDTGIEFTGGRSYDGLQVIFHAEDHEHVRPGDGRSTSGADATVVIFLPTEGDLCIAHAEPFDPIPTAATASSHRRRWTTT